MASRSSDLESPNSLLNLTSNVSSADGVGAFPLSKYLGSSIGVNRFILPKVAKRRTASISTDTTKTQAELRERALMTARSPSSLEELVEIMSVAGRSSRHLKAIGSGFAFSNIHASDGFRVSLTKHINQPLQLEHDLLKDPSKTNLCRLQGGTTIETLTQHLWANGQALLNQPGYEKLTFIGTAYAGGHGSGIRLGPVSDALRSIHLLTFDAYNCVVEKQIEPTDGITDPAKFRKRYPSIELIQDDDTFNASTVCMGAVGVVYSAIIEVREAFSLAEDRLLVPWDELKDSLPSMLGDQDLHSFHVWFNPYKIGGRQLCLVSEYRETIETRRGKRGIGIRMGGRQRMIDALLQLSATYPQLSPRIINSALHATASKNVVRPSYEALNLGSPNGLKLTASEYGVGVEHCIEAAEDVSNAFQGLASETGSYVLSPVALRFVRRSSGMMSPMFGRDTCMLEMPLLDGLPNRENFLQLFWETLAPYSARPHWGQRNNIDASRARRLFPRFSEFQRKVSEINPGKLFESEFTRTLSLNCYRDSEFQLQAEAISLPLRRVVR